MFYRFSSKPCNREADYKFYDIRDFNSESDEEKCNSPEKLILNELNERNKNSPLSQYGRKKLSPLAQRPVLKPVVSTEHTQHADDGFVVDFQPEAVVTPVPTDIASKDGAENYHVRFEVYEDISTPVKSSKDSVLVSPDSRFKSNRTNSSSHLADEIIPFSSENSLLVSPGFRFKQVKAGQKKISERESRSPLVHLNRAQSETHREMEFQVEDIEDEFDTELLFSRIRHNRTQYVVEAFEKGCDPFVADSNGNTMLHICAQNNLKKMANLCIKNGCDLNATNRKGMTPLDYCDMLKFSMLAEWMVVMGAENGNGGLRATAQREGGSFHTTRSMR